MEQVPEDVDTSPRPEDGPSDVDQDPGMEEAEVDEGDASLADPAVMEATP
jgi:hypothetical protein